jgi:hypothetical protein
MWCYLLSTVYMGRSGTISTAYVLLLWCRGCFCHEVATRIREGKQRTTY